jgi:reverse gyrase
MAGRPARVKKSETEGTPATAGIPVAAGMQAKAVTPATSNSNDDSNSMTVHNSRNASNSRNESFSKSGDACKVVKQQHAGRPSTAGTLFTSEMTLKKYVLSSRE